MMKVKGGHGYHGHGAWCGLAAIWRETSRKGRKELTLGSSYVLTRGVDLAGDMRLHVAQKLAKLRPYQSDHR
jgi:hypothetical protein